MGVLSRIRSRVFKRVEGRIDAEVYRQILIHQAMPELKKLIQAEPKQVAWCFQHDNASVHTANSVKQYLENKQNTMEIKVLPWPPQSADLNPIENIYGPI